MALFIEEFERSENTDTLFGVIGRALVVATRFDTMCKTLATAIDIKPQAWLRRISEADFDLIVEKAVRKSSTLDKSITNLALPGDLSLILQNARKARNAIAHDLAVGLEGCIDTKVNESEFIRQISEYIFYLAHGDVLISILISEFNGEDPIRQDLIPAYKGKLVSWVIDK